MIYRYGLQALGDPNKITGLKTEESPIQKEDFLFPPSKQFSCILLHFGFHNPNHMWRVVKKFSRKKVRKIAKWLEGFFLKNRYI